MTRIKVIGVGSPYGADQIGWHVVERLKSQNTQLAIPDTEITCITTDRPGLRLLHYLKDTDIAIIVDAIDEPSQKNRILVLDRSQLTTKKQILSSHSIDLSEVLTLGHILGELPAHLFLTGPCVDVQAGEMPGEALLNSLVNTVLNILAKTCTTAEYPAFQH